MTAASADNTHEDLKTMATALVLNLPEHGHMNATFPLVAELVARGERVVYLATEAWRSRVEASGAAFTAYEADAALFDPPAHRGGLYSVMAYLIGVAEQVLPDVLRHIEREKPDYLLIDSMCVWGRLAQQVTGLPAVTLGSVFVPNDAHVSMDDMVKQAYGQAPREVLLAGVDALNTYLRISQRIDHRYGTISPSVVEFFANRQRLNVIFTSKYFHLAGDSYDDSYLFVGPSVAPRADASVGVAADPGAVFALPEGDQPLIYVSMGTIFNDQLPFFRAAIEALADGPWRVVMSIGNRIDRSAIWPHDDRPCPRNIAIHEFVPQLEVLAKASLCITHGGMNTTSEALWHGVPLLVFPQHGDQHLVAARVLELGAGLRLIPPDIEPARLRALVTQVLDVPSFKQQADRIASSFHAAGGATRAAGEIVAFIADPTAVGQAAAGQVAMGLAS
jgi:MGT family glycosyltransferase